MSDEGKQGEPGKDPEALVDPHAKPAPPPPESTPDSELIIRRRPMWPFLLVLLAIAGGVTFAVLHFVKKPEPLKVLVAIDYQGMPWDGAKASAKLSDSLCDLLKKVGFDPVKTGDPEVDKVLTKAKSPEEAARTLKAAFVITGTLTPTIVEEKLPAGSDSPTFYEARVDGDIVVRQIEDADGKVDKGHVSDWGGAPDKDEAIHLVTDGLTNIVFDEIAPRMMAHASIQELFSGGDVRAQVQISEAKKYVERRGHQLDDVKKKYDDLAKAHASTPQPIRKITYYGSFDEDDSLATAGPDGFLVQTADVSPLVVPDGADLARIVRLERLEWRAPGGGEPKVVWKGYHLYSYPSAAPGGSPVVFIEDLYGRAKTITAVDKDGKARRVRVDPTYRFTDPKIAPGGGAAAMMANPCRGCPAGFLVVSLADGKTLHERTGDERYGGYTWLDAHRVAYFVKPPPSLDVPPPDDADDRTKSKGKDADKAPKDTYDLVVYDTQTNAAHKIAGYEGESGFAFPSASPDGKRIAVGHASDQGQFLALIDSTSGKLVDISVAPSGLNPVFSPDGTMIAYGEEGDIRLYHVKEGTVDELTKNPIDERYPEFSADGSLVFFESRDTDPNLSNRSVRVIASVPVKP